MTGAPDLVARIAVLHGAVQMGADGGEGAPFGIAHPHQQGGLAAELDDLPGVGFQILGFAAGDLVDRGLGHIGRIDELDSGIKEGSDRGCKPAA